MERERVVIQAPDADGGRRVRLGGRTLGTARSARDLLEFMRRAGLDPEQVRLDDPDLLEWHGVGPESWL